MRRATSNTFDGAVTLSGKEPFPYREGDFLLYIRDAAGSTWGMLMSATETYQQDDLKSLME